MKGKLILVSPDGQTRDISFEGARITVGRRAGNDLHFDRAEISGNHAVFSTEEDRFFIMDLGSTNGTLLNGAQLVAQQKYTLEDGDVISIAPYLITFRTGNDLMDTFAETLQEPAQRIGFGTVVDRSGVRTGTEESKKIELPLEKTVSKSDSKPLPPLPPQPPEIKEPEPAPARLVPQPPPPLRKATDRTATAKPDQSGKRPRTAVDYLWLVMGALILLAALTAIAFVLMT